MFVLINCVHFIFTLLFPNLQELARVNQELAKEKQKIEEYHQEMLSEYEKLRL